MRLRAISISIILLLTVGAAMAQKGPSGSELRDAVNKVADASVAINQIMRSEKGIPRDLLRKAKAVVVFPDSKKAAFIVGGQGGRGVAVKRVDKGWSAPAFLEMGGASFGFQIGGSKTDYIMLIMNDDGLRSLLSDKFEMGGEGSVAAGPVGRTAAASTTGRLGAGILTYARSKGAFAGVSLKGVVITHDNDKNREIYQKTAREILGDPPVLARDAPSALRRLGETLSTYTN